MSKRYTWLEHDDFDARYQQASWRGRAKLAQAARAEAARAAQVLRDRAVHIDPETITIRFADSDGPDLWFHSLVSSHLAHIRKQPNLGEVLESWRVNRWNPHFPVRVDAEDGTCAWATLIASIHLDTPLA